MRKARNDCIRILVTALILSACISGTAWAQAIFIINSDGDAGLANSGQTTCSTGSTVNVPDVGTVNECTLRAALEAANNQTQSVTIEYASTMQCLQIFNIVPQTPYPEITNTITVDAQTHPCASTAFNHYPIVNGENISTVSAGIQFSSGSDGSALQGMQLQNFAIGIAVAGSQDVVLDSIRVHNSKFEGLLLSDVLNVSLINSVVSDSGRLETADGIRLDGTLDSQGVLIRSTEIHGSSGNGIRLSGGSEIRIGEVRTISNFPNPLIIVCEGNNIHSNDGHGIRTISSDVQVLCNDIHANGESGVVVATGDEIQIGGDGTGTQVDPYRGNRIHSNGAHGIETQTVGELDLVGNWIGTNLTGDVLGNTLDGIHIEAGLLPSGGQQTTRVLRNDIANNENGIVVEENGIAQIGGNRVMSNSVDGIVVRNFGTAVGLSTTGGGNIVGNSGNFGILVEPPTEVDGAVFVLANWIGTDETGADLGNQGGIGVRYSATGTYDGFILIGRLDITSSGTWSNVIGHNQTGVEVVHGANVRISGNYIGTNVQGDDLGNEKGIDVIGSDWVRIGEPFPDYESTDPGSGWGNVIAYNDQGVELNQSPTTGGHSQWVSILGNRFQGNGPRGVSLGDGGNVIDPGGGAHGNNGLQNFPEVDDIDTYYDESTGLIHYRYRVSTNVDNATYPLRVDFYLADGTSAQGLHWIGHDTYSSGSANTWVTGTFEPVDGVNLQGGYLTAMATDAIGNSSEFLPNVVFLAEIVDELFTDRFELE